MNDAVVEPPDWAADSLSAKYFKNAEYNDRATAANYPDVFAFLKRINAGFERIEEAIENDGAAVRIVPRFLLVRTGCGSHCEHPEREFQPRTAGTRGRQARSWADFGPRKPIFRQMITMRVTPCAPTRPFWLRRAWQ